MDCYCRVLDRGRREGRTGACWALVVCVCFTEHFRAAEGLWLCLVLAAGRELLLELLSYCPSEFLCSGPGLWDALGAEAADAVELESDSSVQGQFG